MLESVPHTGRRSDLRKVCHVPTTRRQRRTRSDRQQSYGDCKNQVLAMILSQYYLARILKHIIRILSGSTSRGSPRAPSTSPTSPPASVADSAAGFLATKSRGLCHRLIDNKLDIRRLDRIKSSPSPSFSLRQTTKTWVHPNTKASLGSQVYSPF